MFSFVDYNEVLTGKYDFNCQIAKKKSGDLKYDKKKHFVFPVELLLRFHWQNYKSGLGCHYCCHYLIENPKYINSNQ